MRRWVSLPLISLALLAGCGSSDDERTHATTSATAKASSASASAAVVARTFFYAGKSGRGATACALMTADAVADLARYVESTGHGVGNRARDCATYFTGFQTSMGGNLTAAEIGRVTENGNVAHAAVVCEGCRHFFHPLLLRKTASGWRVDFDYRKGY
jgi:hypothetical protein